MYSNKKHKDIGGYPSPLVSNEEKAMPSYGLQYLKQMYNDWLGTGDFNYNTKRDKYDKLRRYAEGNQDINKYKDLLDVEGDTSYLNLDWSPVAVVPKFVDVIVEGMDNQEYEVKANAIDPVSQDKRQADRLELLFNMENKEFLTEVSEASGMDLAPKGYVPESTEELDLYMSLNYKQAVELSLEQGIEWVFSINDYSELKKRLLRDLVVLNKAAVKSYTSPNEGVKIRYVDPSKLITSYSTSPDYKNIQHAGEIYNITISDLRVMAGDQFSEKDLENIARTYSGKNGNPRFSNDSALTSQKYREYDDFSVTILDAEFMSSHSMTYEKKENVHGGYSVNKKSSNYKPSKNSKTKREKLGKSIKVVYKGKYIVGSEFVFDYGLCENMIRPKSNLSETRLSYVMYEPNLFKMSSKSLVERMLPFADQIQLSHLKIQHLLAKARPKGAAFELGSLENVSKGDGGTFTPLELQEVYDQTGNIYYRRQDDEGNATQYMPIQELENGIGNDVMNLIRIYQHNLQMLRDVSGVNEARDASQPSSEALVGVQKLALLASNNATRRINDAYLNITKRLAQSVCQRIQDVVEYSGPLKAYSSALGESNVKVVELTKDLSLHEIGIAIEVAPDAEEKQLLENNIQISLAQKELRIEDAIMIRSINNVKLANQMLIVRRKKYIQEQQAMAQQNAQMNAQAQQESAMMASQIKSQDVQMEAQIEQANIATKHQAEMERMQMEYQLKAQLQREANELRLREIEMANYGKVKASEKMGESRMSGIDRSAFHQSQMIEQRKDKKPPMKEEEEKLDIF